MTLPELIAALKAAAEPSRELDLAIRDIEILWTGTIQIGEIGGDDWLYLGVNGPFPYRHPVGYVSNSPKIVYCPRYTGSIDAALTLVPKGWRVATIGQNDNGSWWCELREGHITSYASVVFGLKSPTAPLALCIAALKARMA